VRGAIIGFVAGAILGAIIGVASGDDPCADPSSPDCDLNSIFSYRYFSAGEKALIYGWSIGVVGGGLGVAFGSIKIKIPINNNRQTFLENKDRLKNYSMVK
jgi:hypothetical protein